MSTAASLATSETISDPVDDEALESVDDEVAVDALETLEAELDESSAVNRLVRSVSSFDSRLLALDELSVELEEVEAHLRAICGTDWVAAVGWPLRDGLPQRITAFVSGTNLESNQIQEAMRARVYSYMVPAQIINLPQLPLSSNGETDRKLLLKMLAEGSAG